MILLVLRQTALTLALAFAMRAFAAPEAAWQPLSTTASAITGAVTLGASELRMANRVFPLSGARDVEAAHLAEAAKLVDLADEPVSAKLFRTRIPGATKLLHSNTICGADEDATWLLAVFSDGRLALAFFSGAAEPEIDSAVVGSKHGLCGTFHYAQAGPKSVKR